MTKIIFTILLIFLFLFFIYEFFRINIVGYNELTPRHPYYYFLPSEYIKNFPLYLPQSPPKYSYKSADGNTDEYEAILYQSSATENFLKISYQDYFNSIGCKTDEKSIELDNYEETFFCRSTYEYYINFQIKSTRYSFYSVYIEVRQPSL